VRDQPRTATLHLGRDLGRTGRAQLAVDDVARQALEIRPSGHAHPGQLAAVDQKIVETELAPLGIEAEGGDLPAGRQGEDEAVPGEDGHDAKNP